MEGSRVQKELIPFIMMYLYLNYDYIFPNNTIKKKRSHKLSISKQTNDITPQQLRRKILRSANCCVKQIENLGLNDDNQALSQLCAEKFQNPVIN